jgi:uncharacterized protein YukE
MKYEYLISTLRDEYASYGRNFDTLELGEKQIALEDKHIAINRESPAEVERLRKRYQREKRTSATSYEKAYKELHENYNKLYRAYEKVLEDDANIREQYEQLGKQFDALRDDWLASQARIKSLLMPDIL